MLEDAKENKSMEEHETENEHTLIKVQHRCGAEMCTSASLCPDMVGLSKAARLVQLR